MLKKNTLLLLSIFFLGGCKHKVSIPDVNGCAVKGNILNGAQCATMSSNKVTQLNMDEFIAFLSPDPATGYEGAISYTVKDLTAIKTAMEQACNLLKKSCVKEMREELNKINNSIELLKVVP